MEGELTERILKALPDLTDAQKANLEAYLLGLMAGENIPAIGQVDIDELTRYVGNTLKFFCDVIYREAADEPHEVFIRMIQVMSEDALGWFNNTIGQVASYLEDVKFEPIEISQPQLKSTGLNQE